MPNLVRLSLAANPSSNFKPPVGLFDKLGPKLAVLDMSTSNLTEKELSPELFAPLVNLKVTFPFNEKSIVKFLQFFLIQELDLSYNQITQLRPTVFQSLAKLRVSRAVLITAVLCSVMNTCVYLGSRFGRQQVDSSSALHAGEE